MLQTISEFLYEEAELLDTQQFEEWLNLFDDPCRYYVPLIYQDMDAKRSRTPESSQIAIIDDDRQRLVERIYRITSTFVPCQTPSSRTLHMLSNVRATEDSGKAWKVRCNVSIAEIRPGDVGQRDLGVVRTYYGRCRYLLKVEGISRIHIREKHCEILNAEFPHYNLTFPI